MELMEKEVLTFITIKLCTSKNVTIPIEYTISCACFMINTIKLCA